MKDKKVIIALDAMGGDRAPRIVIEGAAIALKKHKELFFNIFGNQEDVLPLIEKYKILKGNYNFFHTSSVITNEDKPSQSIRKGQQSSMMLAIKSVREGASHAVVSAGNTGALMAMSRLALSSIKGINRPAIVTYIPTIKNPCVVLDLGANAECTSQQLQEFAVMGDAFCKSVLDNKNPAVGILNIGAENLKGNKLVQEAAEKLENNKAINYQGFAEGHDIFKGNFDVVVTDGFTGNIFLKTVEGTFSFCKYKLTNIFKGNYFAYIWIFLGLLFSIFSLRRTYNEVNPKRYNGAMLIGLDGISVKSHGSADGVAFANSIKVAKKLVVGNVNDKIKKELQYIEFDDVINDYT